MSMLNSNRGANLGATSTRRRRASLEKAFVTRGEAKAGEAFGMDGPAAEALAPEALPGGGAEFSENS